MTRILELIVLTLCFVANASAANKHRTIDPVNPKDPERLANGTKSSVLIVGATPGGLMAALDLASRGFQVKIVDSRNWLGGDYAMMKVTNSSGPFIGSYLPRLYEAIYNNAFQTQELMTKLDLQRWTVSTDKVHMISPKKMLRTVEGHKYATTFYTELDFKFVYTYSCLLTAEMWRFYGTQRTLAAMNEPLMRQLYGNYTLQQLMKALSISQNAYECFLQPFASGTGQNDNQISAHAALSRMLYYVTTDSFAVRNAHLLPSMKNDSINLMTRMVDQLKKYNVTMETGYQLRRLHVDGPQGLIVGDLDRQSENFNYVLLAGDAQSTLDILNATKTLNDGAPKIFLPLHAAMLRMAGLKNAPATKVATLWLNKPVNDMDHSIIVFSGYQNVERVSVLNHLSPRDSRFTDSSSVIQVVLKNCTEQFCNRSKLWTNIAQQVTDALPDLRNATATDVVITDRVDGVDFQVHDEQRRERVNFVQRLGIKNLVLGGNWLETSDYPSDGLERDLSLGREAANAILLDAKVRQVPLTVPINQGTGVFQMRKSRRG